MRRARPRAGVEIRRTYGLVPSLPVFLPYVFRYDIQPLASLGSCWPRALSWSGSGNIAQHGGGDGSLPSSLEDLPGTVYGTEEILGPG